MLTQKQMELLVFINERINGGGVTPSFDEMKDALQLKSKSGIHRLVTALEERGFIRRLAHRARAIEVLKMPPQPPARKNFAPQLVVHDGMQGRRAEPARTASPLAIPIMGRIAAGVPRSAIEDHSRSIMLDPEFFSSGEHFALEVSGDSMIDAGIVDGDLAIIRRAEHAESGEIVVALIDDDEATLKRMRRKGQAIALEAANPAYETRIFGPDRIKVQGRLVGLVRRF